MPVATMPFDTAHTSFLLPLAMFSFVSSVTPGPNNVMLTASGATFGYRRTVPHMLGITLGVVVMVLLVGAGLGAVFERLPVIYTALKYLGAAYLVWLAWKIAG
ncbi:LysE family transporter, partial [Delftia sp. 67-8]